MARVYWAAVGAFALPFPTEEPSYRSVGSYSNHRWLLQHRFVVFLQWRKWRWPTHGLGCWQRWLGFHSKRTSRMLSRCPASHNLGRYQQSLQIRRWNLERSMWSLIPTLGPDDFTPRDLMAMQTSGMPTPFWPKVRIQNGYCMKTETNLSCNQKTWDTCSLFFFQVGVLNREHAS